jgi:hypothetical protein
MLQFSLLLLKESLYCSNKQTVVDIVQNVTLQTTDLFKCKNIKNEYLKQCEISQKTKIQKVTLYK